MQGVLILTDAQMACVAVLRGIKGVFYPADVAAEPEVRRPSAVMAQLVKKGVLRRVGHGVYERGERWNEVR